MKTAELISHTRFYASFVTAKEIPMGQHYKYYGKRLNCSYSIGPGHNNPPPTDMSYSNAVHFRLILGVALIVVSGILSVCAVVFESRPIGIAGAVVITAALFVLTSWLELAASEREENTR